MQADMVGIVIGVSEGVRRTRILLLGFGRVADFDTIGFRISADTGNSNSHAHMMVEVGVQIKVLKTTHG